MPALVAGDRVVMNYWRDKVAIITGGAAGLGRVLAGQLAGRNAQLILADRDQQALDDAVDQLGQHGARVRGIATDITRQADVDQLFQNVTEREGQLNLLINCAGRSTRGEILNTTPEDFDSLLQLNFYALVRCTRAAAEPLLATGGHVVNIGSLAAKMAARFLGAYPVSKHAVAAYSQQLRLELGPRGLHVLLVCPGPIARPDAGHRYADQAQDLPVAAQRPGGGVRIKGLDPDRLAQRILRACELRKPELVIPWRARLLATLCQLAPRWGDALILRKTS